MCEKRYQVSAHTHTHSHTEATKTSTRLQQVGWKVATRRRLDKVLEDWTRRDKAREVLSGRRPAPTVQNKSSAITLQALGPHKYLYMGGEKPMFCIILCWTMQLMGNWQDATTSQRIRGVAIVLLCSAFHIANLTGLMFCKVHCTQRGNLTDWRNCLGFAVLAPFTRTDNPLPSIDKLLPGDHRSPIKTAIVFASKYTDNQVMFFLRLSREAARHDVSRGGQIIPSSLEVAKSYHLY